jgi:hypothetical protein
MDLQPIKRVCRFCGLSIRDPLYFASHELLCAHLNTKPHQKSLAKIQESVPEKISYDEVCLFSLEFS